MGTFWKNVGKGFAYVGKGALYAARWASAHPEVIAIIASAVKLPPATAQAIEAGVTVAGEVIPPQ